MAGQLSMRLLGELQVMRDGRIVELPASKKTRSLLGYLIATGRPHRRERLCSLLWDGPDDPRAQLRWSLAKLRPVVDDPSVTRLVADREHAGFEALGATIDLATVRAELSPSAIAETSTERLLALVAMFRGEFLDGLDLTGCYRFHEWCVGEREAARSLRVALLSTLVERLRDRPEQALVHARARVGIDPLSEQAHAVVVELLGLLGRMREARDQIETCKRILEQELGAKPSMVLERARMALGRVVVEPSLPPIAVDVAVAAAPEPKVPPPRSQPRSPLVGREAERAIIDRATGGEAHEALLFLGDPGMGKTRLLEELATSMRERGGVVLVGRGFEAEMVRPYGAFIDALRAVPRERIADSLRADLSPLLPELGHVDPGGRDRARLFEAVGRLLSELGAPVALVLDDVHWLDEASAALVHFIARQASRPLLALGARRAELLDNPALSRLLRALARDRRLVQIELQPLTRTEVVALSESIGVVGAAERMFAEGEGNPLFSLEVAGAFSRGEARSGSLDELIDERLSRIEGRAADLLGWAAALGRSFDGELLGDVTGVPAADLLNGIEELERRGIIRVGADASRAPYDFVHDLIRDGAYRRLSAPRRKLVHMHIARALSSRSEQDDARASELAHHASLGGDHELAARSYLRAAERSLRVYAFVEACALAQRGLVHASRLADRPRVELSMSLLAVRANARPVGDAARALDEELSSATSEARRLGLGVTAQQGSHLLSLGSYLREDYGLALAAVLALVDTSKTADATAAVPALSNAGSCLALLGRDIAHAQALLEDASQRARASGTSLPETQHFMGVGAVEHHAGRLDQAVRRFAPIVEATIATGDHFRACTCLSHLAMIALERGELPTCRAHAERLATVAGKLGEGSEKPFADVLHALARQAEGDERAGDDVAAALAGLRAADSKALLAYALNRAAEHDLDRGALDRAVLRAEEARAAADAVKRASDVAVADTIIARVALARGDVAFAEGCLRDLLPDLAAPMRLSARARTAAKTLADALGVDSTLTDEHREGDDPWPT